jgi:hypothetical protein
MGFLKSKKKTKTEVVEKHIALSKIVKFTYIQSLAVEQQTIGPGKLAGETESASNRELSTIGGGSSTGRTAQQIGNVVGVLSALGGNFLGGLLSSGIGSAVGSLFGKKKKTSTSIETTETGWNVTKLWNQPQFDIIRYAIGIKELGISQFNYAVTSEIVSIPWTSPKEITKVVVKVDQFVPSIFPPGNYIEYYVKPNTEESEWTRINPLDLPTIFDESGSIVPRVINFNTEQPLSSRLEDSYVLTDAPVKEVVFKAVLKRPEALENTSAAADGYSPILKSYRLVMTPKNGL